MALTYRNSKNGAAVLYADSVYVATADTTIPTMVGVISVGTITTASFVISWQAATDNVAVTGYKVSIDGGTTYTDVGKVLTSTRTGLTAATTYNVKVYAYDAAGNASAPLTATVATTSSSDITAPVMAGSVIVSFITSGGFTFSYTAGNDNVGITGYEASIVTGIESYASVGNVLTSTKTGLLPSTLYNVRVRAFDAAGNRSNVITTTVTTAVAQQFATNLTLVFKNRAGVIQASLTGMKWAFFDTATPDGMTTPSAKGTGASTSISGVIALNITGTKLPPGGIGWLIFSNSDGTPTQGNLISFAGPCVVN